MIKNSLGFGGRNVPVATYRLFVDIGRHWAIMQITVCMRLIPGVYGAAH